MKNYKPFKDRYGRYQRVVWCGLKVCRLQDNRGVTRVMRIESLINLI